MKRYLKHAITAATILLVLMIVFRTTNIKAAGIICLSGESDFSQPVKDSDGLPIYYMEPGLVPAWWHIGDIVNFRFAHNDVPPGLVYLTAIITGVSGNEIAHIKTTRADLKSHGWIWKPTKPGYYEVKFSFVGQDGIEKALGRSYTMKARNGVSHIFTRYKQGFAVLPRASAVGKAVGQFGFTYSGNPLELKLAKLLGFSLVRLSCDWGAHFTNLKGGIESIKGQYNWKTFDKRVDLFSHAGFIISAQFCYTPLWASPYPKKTNVNICVVEGTAYAPKDMNDFSRFVEAVVSRYRDRIALWSIWNEPSVPGGSVFWSDTPENFVKLLKAGYEAVKKVQPNGQVWIGGLGPRAPYYAFYNKILQLGAARYFDVLSLHGAWNTPAEKFRCIAENNHIAPKPAVSGEWHAILQGNMQSEPILSERALSFKMMKDLFYQLKQGISRTMLFEMINLSEKETLPFAKRNKMFTHSSGLFRRRPQIEPRQAAVVMANFLHVTDRYAAYVKEFKLADDAVALELVTGEGPIVAFWSSRTPLKMKALKPFITSASVLHDWEGKSVSIDPSSVLDTNEIYYLSRVNTEAIARARAADNLISPRLAVSKAQKITQGSYYIGRLFDSSWSIATVAPTIWIQNNWKHSNLAGGQNDNKFSARAAVGAHEEGLDIVVEVHYGSDEQNGSSSRLASENNNVQIAIDCERNGLPGGNTVISASSTGKGPVVEKLQAADPHGDIPARWSSAGSIAKYVKLTIRKENDLIRYQIRIPWSELYPLVYDPLKPLRISLAVKRRNKTGEIDSIVWGGGILKDMNPSKYGILYPNRMTR
jgi:hypothetical protein